MRCYFTNDSIAGRVLIPGCWGAAVYQDLSYCTCPPRNKRDEIEALKYQIEKLENRILELEKAKINDQVSSKRKS